MPTQSFVITKIEIALFTSEDSLQAITIFHQEIYFLRYWCSINEYNQSPFKFFMVYLRPSRTVFTKRIFTVNGKKNTNEIKYKNVFPTHIVYEKTKDTLLMTWQAWEMVRFTFGWKTLPEKPWNKPVLEGVKLRWKKKYESNSIVVP